MAGKILVVAGATQGTDSQETTGVVERFRQNGYQANTYACARELGKSRFTQNAQPSCILLELSGSKGQRFDQLDQLRLLTNRQCPPVIVLAAHPDIKLCVTAMKAGAFDFLASPIADSTLHDAIEEALAKSSMDLLVRDIDEHFATRMETLTIREQEVLLHLISGRLNKVIAADLGISEKTVKVHRARVLEKMQLRSLAELVRECTINGLEPAHGGSTNRLK